MCIILDFDSFLAFINSFCTLRLGLGREGELICNLLISDVINTHKKKIKEREARIEAAETPSISSVAVVEIGFNFIDSGSFQQQQEVTTFPVFYFTNANRNLAIREGKERNA
jgi:hypothetical protein